MKPAFRSALPGLLLPAAGLGGIVALFYFGYAQELSIKVALGLAAAALASRVPGLLQVKSKTVSTSGAIAVFVIVMFSEDISRTFSPAAKIPGVSSHVRLSRDQMQYQSEIASAQFEIMNENYDGAPNDGSVWTAGGCVSWYLDATGRNTANWPGYTFEFMWKTRAPKWDEYVVR